MLVCYITIYLWINNLTNHVQVTDANLLLVATSLFEKLRSKTSKSLSASSNSEQKRSAQKQPNTKPIPYFSDQVLFGPPIIPSIEIPVFEPIRDDEHPIEVLQMSESSPSLSSSALSNLLQIAIPLYWPQDLPTTLFDSDYSHGNSLSYEPLSSFETYGDHLAQASLQSPNIQTELQSSYEPMSLHVFLLDQLMQNLVSSTEFNNEVKQTSTTASNRFVLNSPKEILEASENRNSKSLRRPFWLDLHEPPPLRNFQVPRGNFPIISYRYPFYLDEFESKSSYSYPMIRPIYEPSNQNSYEIVESHPNMVEIKFPPLQTESSTNWPHSSRYEPVVSNNDQPSSTTVVKKDDDNNNEQSNNKNDTDEFHINKRAESTLKHLNLSSSDNLKDPLLKPMEIVNEAIQQEPIANFIPIYLDNEAETRENLRENEEDNETDSSNKQEENTFSGSEHRDKIFDDKVQMDEEKENEEDSEAKSSLSTSKLESRNKYYRDKGHVKHGWKNVYHKEEWGEANKYHDIWRYKDWKNRYYNQQQQQQQQDDNEDSNNKRQDEK